MIGVTMKQFFINFLFATFLIFFSSKLYSETFVFSGGCFWCTEADFEKIKGVKNVISGFTGGTTENPRYYPGEYGDHREAALVIYDPQIIRFDELVVNVFKTIDFEDNEGQFCDRGRAYTPAIYYKNNREKEIIKTLSPKSSVVPIELETKFYPVREEHQNFYKKNKFKYNYYRFSCGRDNRIDQLKYSD